MTTAPPPRGRRPRNRKQLIVAAAAELFARDGYPHTGVSEIASAVGVRPSALYRHVSDKESLLYEVVHDALDVIDTAVAEPDPLPAMASAVLEHRTLGVLWQRESRHLEPRLRQRLRTQLVAAVRRFGDHLRAQQPARTDSEADLLSWAVADALMSVSFQRVQLSPTEYTNLLTGVGEAILGTKLIEATKRDLATAPEPRPAPQFRRDEVFSAAIQQFAEHGFAGVSIDDIGAAAGIAGPSIYHHVPSKVDILSTTTRSGVEDLQSDLTDAINETTAPADTLARLLEAYTGYSFRHHNLMDVLIAESAHLPESDRRFVRDAQRDYIAHWVELLRKAHPEMSNAHARVRVQAALNIVNDIARTPHLCRRPGAQLNVRAIAHRILDLTDAAD